VVALVAAVAIVAGSLALAQSGIIQSAALEVASTVDTTASGFSTLALAELDTLSAKFNQVGEAEEVASERAHASIALSSTSFSPAFFAHPDLARLEMPIAGGSLHSSTALRRQSVVQPMLSAPPYRSHRFRVRQSRSQSRRANPLTHSSLARAPRTSLSALRSMAQLKTLSADI